MPGRHATAERSTRRTEAAAPREPLLRAFSETREEELLRALSSVLGSREDALDVTQEVFLRCWRFRGTPAALRDPRACLFRVGPNAAGDLQRSAWRRRALPLAGEFATTPPPDDDHLERREQLERLRAVLGCLAPAEKEAFLLRHESLTYGRIARRCGRPVGTVKTQMRSALRKLRDALARSPAGGGSCPGES